MINEQLFNDVSYGEKEAIYIDERLEFEHLNSSIIEQNYYQILIHPLVKYSVKERLIEAKRKKEEEALKLINSKLKKPYSKLIKIVLSLLYTLICPLKLTFF